MNDLEEKLLDKIMDLQRTIVEQEYEIGSLKSKLYNYTQSSLDREFFWN